ncbi:MAG: glutathione S-transferase family protein [Granulosicoccaceae bacterium]
MELVSFDLCPFVQRSVITLKCKGVEHKVTYIDLENPPQWFSDISPLGKVPLLKTEGEVLFESAAINEYIDETTGEPLHPAEPLRRAHNRAWIEFASNLIVAQYKCMLATDEASYLAAADDRDSLLRTLESQLRGGPYFNGSVFALVDAAFAPFFTRQALTQGLHPREALDDFPKCRQWSEALLGQSYVSESVVEDFADRFKTYFSNRDNYLYQAH